MAEKAYITPEVILWARVSANISLDDAAKKVGVKVEKLAEWEKGQAFPTVRQAIKLANIYRRPFAAFFLPEPPKDFALLQDFRRISNNLRYSTALIFMLREIQEKQQWMSDFLKDNGEPPLPFIGQFTIKDSTRKIAREIVKYLGIENAQSNNLKHWIQKSESKGIFVSKAGSYHNHLPILVEEARGFVISDKYAPFMFINSRDLDAAQLFTIVHELVHLWIGESAVLDASLIEFRTKNIEYNEVEVFCNRVAAEILMPEAEILDIFKDVTTDYLMEEMVIFASREFGVSQLAVWTRLKNLNKISPIKYKEIRDRYNTLYSYPKPKPKGGDTYRNKAVRNGKKFCYIVMDSFRNGLITGLEASNLLGVRINKFDKFSTYLS